MVLNKICDMHTNTTNGCGLIVLAYLGSSSFHRSSQTEGVPAPHHLPEEPPQVRSDWR